MSWHKFHAYADDEAHGIGVDWENDEIRLLAFVKSVWPPDLENDVYLDDVPSGARVASVAFSSFSLTAGLVDFDDPELEDVDDPFDAFLVYEHTGVESTSRLIAYIDVDKNGVPISYAGGGDDVTAAFNDGVADFS